MVYFSAMNFVLPKYVPVVATGFYIKQFDLCLS